MYALIGQKTIDCLLYQQHMVWDKQQYMQHQWELENSEH